MKVTLGQLNISALGKKFVNEALDSNRLSRGKYTDQFENSFAAFHGCSHGVFCNSGTSALQIALAALKEIHGYKYGDEVLVPATTFIATSNIVLQNDLKPVFVDVDRFTFNMNPRLIEEKITQRTRAIIPVHLFGLPCDMPRIMEIARKHHLQVLEDSCETVFASIAGKRVGSFGDAACFSTYVNHIIVGGIGGLVLTNDDHVAEISRSLLAHGRDSVYTKIDDDDGLSGSKLQNIIERRFRFERLGYSYRATEMEAAIALSELEIHEENITARRRNAASLMELLKPLQYHIQLPIIPEGSTHAFMMFPMVCKSSVDRDSLLLFLEEHTIETRYLFPLLEQPVYKKLFPGLAERYPVAHHLAENGFMIGIHQGLDLEHIKYISDIFYQFFRNLNAC